MHSQTLIAHAGLVTFDARVKGDQPGPAHAALAISLSHQLLGLVQLVAGLTASQLDGDLV